GAQLRGREDPALRDGLLGCEEELWRGTALLADFLDVDRIRKGSLTLHRTQTDLGELAAKVALAYRDAATRAALEIRVVADGPLVATVDGGLVERVLGNLIANALRFARTGGIISIDVARAGASAVLSVENAGPSIPPEDVPRLFEPFVSTSEVGAS